MATDAHASDPELHRDHIVYNAIWTDGAHWEPAEAVRLMVQKLEKQNDDPLVADLGCGLGRHAVFAAQHGLRTLAVDRNPKALQRIQDASLDLPITVIEQDLTAFIPSMSADSYSGVILFDAIHHLGRTRTDMENILAAIRSSVRAHGLICVTLLCDIDYGAGDWPSNRFMTDEATATRLLRNAFSGWSVLRQKKSDVRFENILNYCSDQGGLVRTYYQATRVNFLVQR